MVAGAVTTTPPEDRPGGNRRTNVERRPGALIRLLGNKCRASAIGGACAGVVAGAGAGAGVAALTDDWYLKLIVVVLSALAGLIGGLAAGAALACWRESDDRSQG